MKLLEPDLFNLHARGLRALVKELGPAGMIQFLQLCHQGSGDYTKERHAWLDNVPADEVAADILRAQGTREFHKRTGRENPPSKKRTHHGKHK